MSCLCPQEPTCSGTDWNARRCNRSGGESLSPQRISAELSGEQISSETKQAYEHLLTQCSAALTPLIAAARSTHPTPDQLLVLADTLEQPREITDMAFDGRHLALFSQRLLSSPLILSNTEASVFAIELRADQSISLPKGVDERPEWRKGPSELFNVSSSLRKHTRLPIVLIGLDANGQLVRATLDDEPYVVRESKDTFDIDRFETWRREFPLRYGYDTQSFNLFFTSTTGIGLTELPSRCALVLDTALHELPANL